MVRGNGWGYETVPYAKCLIEAGVNWLGVTNIEDALSLPAEKINLPILLLCEIPSEWIKEALKLQKCLYILNADLFLRNKRFGKLCTDKVPPVTVRI